MKTHSIPQSTRSYMSLIPALILLIGGALLMAACANPTAPGNTQGTLRIDLPGGSDSRAITAAQKEYLKSLVFFLSGEDEDDSDNTFETELKSGRNEISISEGTWVLLLELFDKDMVNLGFETETVTIKAGQTATASFSFTLDDNGDLVPDPDADSDKTGKGDNAAGDYWPSDALLRAFNVTDLALPTGTELVSYSATSDSTNTSLSIILKDEKNSAASAVETYIQGHSSVWQDTKNSSGASWNSVNGNWVMSVQNVAASIVNPYGFAYSTIEIYARNSNRPALPWPNFSALGLTLTNPPSATLEEMTYISANDSLSFTNFAASFMAFFALVDSKSGFILDIKGKQTEYQNLIDQIKRQGGNIDTVSVGSIPIAGAIIPDLGVKFSVGSTEGFLTAPLLGSNMTLFIGTK